MVRGWEGAGTGQPPSVRLSVRPSRSSCPPAELPQDPALTLQVGRRPLPRAGWRWTLLLEEWGVRFPLGATGQAGRLEPHTLTVPQWRRLGSEVQVPQAGPSRGLSWAGDTVPSTRPQVVGPLSMRVS